MGTSTEVLLLFEVNPLNLRAGFWVEGLHLAWQVITYIPNSKLTDFCNFLSTFKVQWMHNVIFSAYHVLGLRSLLTGRHICIRHIVTLLDKPHHISRDYLASP